MKKNLILVIIIIYSILISSCATVFNGKTEKVTLATSPEGAEVYINGLKEGKTPLEVDLPSDERHRIEFRKEGYESTARSLGNKLGAGWLVLDIIPGFIFGLIPLIVDAATGNWYELEKKSVNASLIKK